MTTTAPIEPARFSWRDVYSLRSWLYVWLPIAVISALHYATSAQHDWVHDVLRRGYYLPIVVAAIRLGLRGGLLASALVSLAYVPHAFVHSGHIHHMAHNDPAQPLEKALEILLYNAVGVVAGYLSDLERRRRVELQEALDEQVRLQEQLVRAGRLSALGEVVAGMAHEVRNPIHSLRGTAEIVDPLIDESLPERRMWDIHKEELQRLDRIAERYLSFARPHVGERSQVRLDDVVARVVELVQADATKKGVTLDTELDEKAEVLADRDQLAQVGLNIALNAMKAIGPDGGRISLRVRAGNGDPARRMHTLEIENTGPPIPEEDLEHLFDPFVTSDEGATGLGLSISARIADEHGGFIEAENRPGSSAVAFLLHLPHHVDA